MYVPADVGVNVYVFVPGVVFAARPVPTGESMFAAVIGSPDAPVKVAVMVVESPTLMLEPIEEVILAVGVFGAVTVSEALCQPSEPLGPMA